MRGTSPVMSTTVDSTPTSQAPPSRISGMRPSMSSNMWAAVVGLGRPERLPLGAAMGQPAARISARAIGWDGMRTATVFSPPVVRRGTRADFGKISVSGPGQYAAISARAAGEGSTAISGRSSSASSMCTISGLSPGRPFASKMLATASGFSASAPSPYTVSVGMPTSLPSRISCAAS